MFDNSLYPTTALIQEKLTMKFLQYGLTEKFEMPHKNKHDPGYMSHKYQPQHQRLASMSFIRTKSYICQTTSQPANHPANQPSSGLLVLMLTILKNNTKGNIISSVCSYTEWGDG